MTIADGAKIRALLKEQSKEIEEKKKALGSLSREFRLDKMSGLGARTNEVGIALEDFERRSVPWMRPSAAPTWRP